MGGSGSDEGRDGACTPKWLADLLGVFDLDPCSNPRSHIHTRHYVGRLMLENGDDGLAGDAPGIYERGNSVVSSGFADDDCRLFCNPPYARDQVIRWVNHYLHTDFTFLLRWDPSTKWFARLWPQCWGAWFPNERMNFEPPPGVTFSSNPFPHALYFRNVPPLPVYFALKERGVFALNQPRKPIMHDDDVVHDPSCRCEACSYALDTLSAKENPASLPGNGVRLDSEAAIAEFTT